MIRVPSGETMALRWVGSVSQPSCGPVNLVPYSTHPIWPGPDCRPAHHSFETPAIWARIVASGLTDTANRAQMVARTQPPRGAVRFAGAHAPGRARGTRLPRE